MNNKMIWLGSVVVAGMIIGFGFLASQNNVEVIPTGPSKYDDFARCVASKDVTMYGAVWCAHCLNEKKAFGSAFQYIKYVECPDNIKLCTDKGVLGYPTWIDGAGKKYEGEQGLSGVAKISGCALPE
jgi:hypothetical protein